MADDVGGWGRAGRCSSSNKKALSPQGPAGEAVMRRLQGWEAEDQPIGWVVHVGGTAPRTPKQGRRRIWLAPPASYSLLQGPLDHIGLLS